MWCSDPINTLLNGETAIHHGRGRPHHLVTWTSGRWEMSVAEVVRAACDQEQWKSMIAKSPLGNGAQGRRRRRLESNPVFVPLLTLLTCRFHMPVIGCIWLAGMNLLLAFHWTRLLFTFLFTYNGCTSSLCSALVLFDCDFFKVYQS